MHKYITPNSPKLFYNTLSFKAQDMDFPQEKELLDSARKGQLTPNSVNKNKDSLFQLIVQNDYKTLVNYLTAKPGMRSEIINFAPNGKTPLDYAVSEEMKNLLRQRGGKYAAELGIFQQPEVPKPREAEDAKVIASKVYMSEPIRVTPSEMQPKQEIETPKPNYFDAFDEIDDTEDVAKEVTKPEENNNNQIILKEEEIPVADYEEIKEEIADEAQTINKSAEKEEYKLPASYKNYAVLDTVSGAPQSLDNIIGMEKIKENLRGNIIIPLNEEAAKATLKANDIDIPNGVLIETGQDVLNLVKAFANETKMPVLQLYNPQELKAMLNDVETEYKKSGKKTIILMRGFDKFFTTGPHCDLDKKNFLLEIENCSAKGAFLIGTADEKCSVDNKFLKQGVFDKVLELKMPDMDERKQYLTEYYKDKYLFKNLNTPEMLEEIAEKTEGFSYADIENVLEECARTSVSNQKYIINPDDLRKELADFTKAAGINPVDDFNKTTMYDTPQFKRVPVTQDEIMKLDDLGGMPEIKEKLKKLYIEPFANLDKLKENLGSSAIPDGAIFYGPAGNGKTLTAKVLARELKLPFYETKLSDVASPYIHEVSRRIREMAKQLNDKFAATGEMSVWFFDEFDSMGEARGENTASHKQEVTDTLLQEFNNPSSKGYILIAATNDLEGIDPALRRRGRLGNWIAFSNPDHEARIDVIKKELAKTPFTENLVNNQEILEKTAKEFDGTSMSTIVSVLTDAKRAAILSGKDFSECIKECFEDFTNRQMGEFCNKAGLKQHEYNDWDFKSLDELGGMEDVKKALEENIIDIWRPEVRQALITNRRSLPGGVILEGPPGTGKTTIVETLARQMNIPLYKMNYNQTGNEYIHGVARNVTDIFERLKLESKIIKKPVMLFFDEAEKFFPRYADRHQVEEVNTYKELMNTAAAGGLILIAATNHIDLVNAEIIGNPRRMGTIIHCGNPDYQSRTNLIEKLLNNLPIIDDYLDETHYAQLAKQTEGLSIGNIADIIDKTITQAVKQRKNLNFDTILQNFIQKNKVIV